MADEANEKAVVEAERIGCAVVVTPLMKEITFRNAKDFLLQVKNVTDRESCNMVLNMEHVELIDSVSLGTLVAIKKYVKRHNSDVSVANLSYMIFELFRLLNFPAVFKIYDTVEQALKSEQ